MQRLTITIGTLLAAAVSTSPAWAGPRDEVIAAFGKAMADGSYRATISAAGQGEDATSVLDVQMPDRFRMTSKAGEFIVLPEGTWMKAGGNWMAVPMNLSGMIQGYTATALKDGMAAIQDVQPIGEADVEGCASKLYAYHASGEMMGMKSESDVEVAICEASGLPIRIVSKDGGDAATLVYDWDADVDIKAPN